VTGKNQSSKMLANTIFTLALCSGLASSQYLKSTYESSSSYYDRYLLDSPYNLCRDPLMRQSAVDATSEASQRTAKMAFLWGGSAWTGMYKSLRITMLQKLTKYEVKA